MIPKIDIKNLKTEQQIIEFEQYLSLDGKTWDKAYNDVRDYKYVAEIELIDPTHRYFLAKDSTGKTTFLYRCKK